MDGDDDQIDPSSFRLALSLMRSSPPVSTFSSALSPPKSPRPMADDIQCYCFETHRRWRCSCYENTTSRLISMLAAAARPSWRSGSISGLVVKGLCGHGDHLGLRRAEQREQIERRWDNEGRRPEKKEMDGKRDGSGWKVEGKEDDRSRESHV
uniref:Uncharacterized protein n=1 Tax=Oryza rufipogon TaxID=4529 RepID=A0A0E0Q967_ORYRU